MVRSLTTPARVLPAMLTTALVSMICMLALPASAQARVSIVPGTAKGGETETFAIRLANERSGVSTTRLELTFPADAPIPQAKVTKVRGWTATVAMVPLKPPVTVGGKEIDKAVGSIVWEGGEVAPKQFEQFLVTAGPLPPEGQLVFTATQSYSDGSEERWNNPVASGKGAGAPTITIVASSGTAADKLADKVAENRAAVAQADGTPAAAEHNYLLLSALVAGGVLVAAAAAFVGYRTVGRSKLMAMSTAVGSRAKGLVDRVGQRLRERKDKPDSDAEGLMERASEPDPDAEGLMEQASEPDPDPERLMEPASERLPEQVGKE